MFKNTILTYIYIYVFCSHGNNWIIYVCGTYMYSTWMYKQHYWRSLSDRQSPNPYIEIPSVIMKNKLIEYIVDGYEKHCNLWINIVSLNSLSLWNALKTSLLNIIISTCLISHCNYCVFVVTIVVLMMHVLWILSVYILQSHLCLTSWRFSSTQPFTKLTSGWRCHFSALVTPLFHALVCLSPFPVMEVWLSWLYAAEHISTPNLYFVSRPGR